VERNDDLLVKIVNGFALKAERLLPDHPSLFSGQSGLSLLYADLFIFTKEEFYANKSIEVLERSIKLLSGGEGGLTLANGVAGVGWLVKYLIKKEILSPLDAENLADFDELLFENLKSDDYRNNRYYDLLFGLIGKGVYFLDDNNSNKTNSPKALEIILDRLKNLSVESDAGRLWYAILGKEQRSEENDYYDYGLAHGLPSIAIFLSKLSKYNSHKVECKQLVQSIIGHLQRQRLRSCISEFPSDSKSKEASRLAWCYGDLGMAFSFIQASIALEKPSLMVDARNIAIHSASRNLGSSLIRNDSDLMENGFCHGTLGLAHLFTQLYNQFGDSQLLLAREYWLSITFGSYNDRITSRDFNPSNKTWSENGNLLNGYCGMGIALLNIHCKSCDGINDIFLLN